MELIDLHFRDRFDGMRNGKMVFRKIGLSERDRLDNLIQGFPGSFAGTGASG